LRGALCAFCAVGIRSIISKNIDQPTSLIVDDDPPEFVTLEVKIFVRSCIQPLFFRLDFKITIDFGANLFNPLLCCCLGLDLICPVLDFLGRDSGH
jgi:hypothetical protein